MRAPIPSPSQLSALAFGAARAGQLRSDLELHKRTGLWLAVSPAQRGWERDLEWRSGVEMSKAEPATHPAQTRARSRAHPAPRSPRLELSSDAFPAPVRAGL